MLFTDIAPNARQVWRHNSRVVSMQLYGGGIVKRWSSFAAHAETEAKFMALIDECMSREIKRPSSYADIFAQSYRSPRLKFSVNAFLSRGFVGAWQDALVKGLHVGPVRRYDINSAYLWAASDGLPDTRTFSYVKGYNPNVTAVFLVRRSVFPHRDNVLPYPFNNDNLTWCLATHEEIKLYDICRDDIIGGVSWRGLKHPGGWLARFIGELPASQHVRKCFWGRWASMGALECQSRTTGNTWKVGNPFVNLVWAHYIIARIKARLWLHHLNAIHVYVDSIITSDIIPTDTAIGGWKLEQEYPNGLVVHGPGIYGVPGQPLEKHAGTQTKGT